MKKAFRFSILSLALALCGGSVALIHAKTNAVKETKAVKEQYVAKDESNNEYATVDDFVDALETLNNKTFTVAADFALTETIDLSGKTATIDLAGHSISGNVNTMFSLTNSTDLTINSNGGTGSIQNARLEVFNLTGATLNLNNISINLTATTANYLPINAVSGSNIINTNNISISKGYAGILLTGNSSLYTSGLTTISGQGNCSINCGSSSFIYFSGALNTNRPIITNTSIAFFDGNTTNPTYLETLANNITVNVSDSLKHDGTLIIKGAKNAALADKITISGLTNSGFDYAVVDSTVITSGNAKDIKTVYYSCVPQITGSKFTIISQDNPAIYSPSSNTVVYELEADFGYYFGTQRAEYLSITIGGGTPLTSSDYSYGYNVVYNAHPYYKRCTITIPRNLIKGQLVIAVTPGISNYLQAAKDFITANMHMDDYDPELTGVGDNSCKTYYATAKDEFLKLGNYHREAFMLSTDQDVINGRERFLAWADANGDMITLQDGTYVIVRKSNILNPIQENNNDIYPVIIISSAIAISSIAVTVLYAKKRKESSR